jgi:gluconokinase
MIVGIDIGTTNIKAVLLDEYGKALARFDRQTRTFSPQPGWQEQLPEEIWKRVKSVLQEATHAATTLEQEVQAVVLSAAMHGLIAVDEDGNCLTSVWLWSDLRAMDVASELHNTPLGQQLYQATGVPVHPMSPMCKMAWMRRHQPAVFASTQYFLDLKSYIWYKLTGYFQVDVSCAAATGLKGVEGMQWHPEALDFAGIEAAQLPQQTPITHQGKIVASEVLEGNTWLHQVPLVMGASDGVMAALGSRLAAPGDLAVTIGTSAAIRGLSSQPVLDADMRTFCYQIEATSYLVGGASNNGTNALEWLKNSVLGSEKSIEAFAAQAADVAPGADGLLFLPYLQGERAPLWDARARGALLGLTTAHTQAHLVRAMMEGIVFNLKSIGHVLGQRVAMSTLKASGGFVHNPVWVQLLADIFEVPVVQDAPGFDAVFEGCWKVGASALGLLQHEQKTNLPAILPNPENQEVYRRQWQCFAAALHDQVPDLTNR